MTPEQFVYWLQGFMEVQNPDTINYTQTQEIKRHLKSVFNKVEMTPFIPNSKESVPTRNFTCGAGTYIGTYFGDIFNK